MEKLLTTRPLLAIALALILCACSPPTPQSLIVGTWEIESGMKATWQFRKDGTGSLTMMGKTGEGTYKFNGQDDLEVTGGGETQKFKANVTADELEVTYQGHVTKFRRKR